MLYLALANFSHLETGQFVIRRGKREEDTMDTVGCSTAEILENDILVALLTYVKNRIKSAENPYKLTGDTILYAMCSRLTRTHRIAWLSRWLGYRRIVLIAIHRVQSLPVLNGNLWFRINYGVRQNFLQWAGLCCSASK